MTDPIRPEGRYAEINRPIFFSSSGIILVMVLMSALFPEAADQAFQRLQSGIVTNASWFYVLAVAIILVGVFFLGIGRYGDIKLGPDHSEPEFSYLTWFSMLFSAGMGIGLMFFGVAEPVMHFLSPPQGEAGTLAAAREAMKLTYFHWGLHAWAIYAIVGMILAYFSFRHGLPLRLSSALYPLIGDRINGPVGYAVDVFAIIGTILGAATSLGYGVSQINAGLNYLLGIPETSGIQVAIIIIVTGLAMASVISGLNKGIRRLSELNMLLAVLLLLLVLCVGPTLFLIQSYVQSTGSYLSEIVNKTFNLYAYEPTDWLGGWTILYWGWWVSWSPFVGMFIARISKGRTIRQFSLGVMFVPAGFTFLWMTVFGNSAIDLILNGEQEQLAEAVIANNSLALFSFFEHMPLTNILSGLAICMVVIFFVTSADSGALVVNMLSTCGNDNTPYWQRVYWTSMIGMVAIVLLLAGGLSSLQSATISGALPFTVVLLWAMYGLLRALNMEFIKKLSMVHTMNTTPVLASDQAAEFWKDRLECIVDQADDKTAKNYIESIGASALREVADELHKRDYEARVVGDNNSVYLTVGTGSDTDFVYGLVVSEIEGANGALAEHGGAQDLDHYYRAEVFLREGNQHYNVIGYDKAQLIHDVLDQYEKHRHFLAMLRS